MNFSLAELKCRKKSAVSESRNLDISPTQYPRVNDSRTKKVC